MDTAERTRAHLEMQKQNKSLDEQVNDLAQHFAQLIVEKDFHISNLNTSGKLRLKCIGEYNRLVNKIDGIVEVWVQASQVIDNKELKSRPGHTHDITSYCKTCGKYTCKC